MNLPISPQTNLSSELRKIITDRNMLSIRSRMKVLQSMEETNRHSALEKQKILRAQSIQEILTTELTYLKQLEILMEFFIQPIFDKNLLRHTLLSTLSENIKTLYNVSGELIQELRLNPASVARPFHKLAPFFKLYSVYAYDYGQVLMLFQTQQESNFILRNFIRQQETRPEVNQKLPALLITPIQRVPRYRLLLKEVLQHTSIKDEEYSLLQASLVEIEKAAKHINNLVEQNEESQKLLMLQKCILNRINLVKPGRRLIKQGSLMRVSRRGNSTYKRYFILLNDILLYCKGDPESTLTVCCVLPLNKCKVECVLSGGLFRVTCIDETLLLYSEKEDSNSWIQCIQTAIKKYTECRQTLRKDSSSRKPLRHNNIHLFPSENIANSIGKRKRSLDKEEIPLNSSDIMYLKCDNEMERDLQGQNRYFTLFKKFKKLNSNEQPKTRGRNNSMCGSTLEINSNSEVFWQSRNGINHTQSNTHSVHLNNENELRPTFKYINNFFVAIGTSIKNLFWSR